MMPDDSRRLAASMVLVAIVAFVASMAGIDARATYGARVTADEPQYLITAISLGDDFSLDVSDELAEERFLPFHEIKLNTQTIDLDDQGRRVSPHDPLLPLLLAVPVLIAGWVGAKVVMGICAALVAALTLRLAVCRLQARLVPAVAVVAGFAASPPFSVYGGQIYPALPAALGVLVGVLAVTTPAPTRQAAVVGVRSIDRATATIVMVVVALPWLSVKYVPLAAVLAIAGLWRSWSFDRRVVVGSLAAYAVAGVSYLALHRWLYGGWTVYAVGDHFVNGEFEVVGTNPNYLARSRRLIGLLVDRQFGLVAWNPAFVAVPVALVWLARSKRPGRYAMLAVFAAGWATATWVALTMHGWWWPGRQVVPVLPVAIAALAALVGSHRRALIAVLSGTFLGIVSWLTLAWEASTGRRTLVVDFDQTSNPWYRVWRLVLPDHQRMEPLDVVLTVLWIAAVVAGGLFAARRIGPAGPEPLSTAGKPGAEPVPSTSSEVASA